MRLLFAAPITFDRATFFISQYTVSLAKAARKIGHDVKVVQTTENRFNPYLWTVIDREYNTLRKYFKKITDFPHDMLLIRQVIAEIKAYKPDFLFLYLDDTSFFPYAINTIKKMGVKIFTWRGLSPHVTHPDVLNLLKRLDYVFIYDRSYTQYYKDIGIDKTHIVPMGCDINYHENIVPDSNFKKQNHHDISFIGIVDEYRERYLKALCGYDMGIWTWKLNNPFSPLKPYVKGVSHGEHMIKLYKSSRIAINIHRRFEQNGGNYRLFEIPACKTLQLVDKKARISDYFKIDREIVTFDSPGELKSKVDYYLKHDHEREAIAQAGYERVKKDHSLTNRMAIMLDTMGLK